TALVVMHALALAGCEWHNVHTPGYAGHALADVRTVYAAETAYASSNDGAFGRLRCLASPTSCGFTAGSVTYLDAELAALGTTRRDWRAFIAGPVGNGKPDPGIKAFVYVATPVDREMFDEGWFFGYPRRRYRPFGYAVDHTGLLCFTTDGSAPPIVDGALAKT